MVPINCEECGHDVPRKFKFCPNCGAPVGKQSKQYGRDTLISAGFVALIMMAAYSSLNLIATSKSAAYTPTTDTTSKSNTTNSPDAAAPTNTQRDLRYVHETINIREGAGKSYEVVGRLKPGDTVEVREIKDEWAKISIDGDEKGYVFEPLLDVNPLPSTAGQPKWSKWELENALSQHNAFVVIKRPGAGACYIKQSYDDDLSKMELYFSGDYPIVLAPFYQGIEGAVEYWIDDGPKHTVAQSRIGGGNFISLVDGIVAAMKSGRALYVHVKPIGRPARTQEFSLLGFIAATQVMASSECRNAR